MDVVAVDSPQQGIDLVVGVLVGGGHLGLSEEHVSESTDPIVHRH
ncbi:hypothetical protein [Nonomuraea dietziae]